MILIVVGLLFSGPLTALAQAPVAIVAENGAAPDPARGDGGATASVELVQGLTRLEGFFDLYINPETGAVMAALPAPRDDGVSLRAIYTTGLTAGLGSNPIGLDRGAGQSGDIIRFRKIGNRIVVEEENWRYRASAERVEEQRAVRQSFASSFLWTTDIAATAPDGTLLIDISGFLTRDELGIAADLKHGEGAGAYALASDRSFPDPDAAFAFPDNVEIDVFLTFTADQTNSETRATAADARAITLVQHHSFVRLPDGGYTLRPFDPRTANIGMGYYDFSSPLAEPIVRRFSRRFRLERLDPSATSGPVREPIVFYVDAGAPEEIRDALIEGASWWAEGFEAAGFEDAYRVEVLPPDAHPLDVRYNVINWVHRQTRGWSYGGSVSDPRTGEILKANVILGSQRVRQDRMIFEGLAGARKTGTGATDDPIEVSLARIRQLSAHEVGHTLGFAHNFAASSNNRASVMDYPAPYIRPTGDGALDFSGAYGEGLGAWDVFTVKWLYSQFPDTVDGAAALDALVDEARAAGLRFVADRHGRSPGGAHPAASVWDNGSDGPATLIETMAVRRIALDGFDPDRLADGRIRSDLNAVFVPIYLYHRYQVAAAAKPIGGLDFRYGVNGDGTPPATPVATADQTRALAALMTTLAPEELDIPDRILNRLTPGDVGYAGVPDTSETFGGRTGPMFDALAAADVAANLTLSTLFHPARAERLIAQAQRNPDALSLETVIDGVEDAVFDEVRDPRLATIARTIQTRYVATLTALSAHSGVSAELSSRVDGKLAALADRISRRRAARTDLQRQHFRSLARRISAHLEGDTSKFRQLPSALQAPPGSPIGSGEGSALDAETGEDCWHCGPIAPPWPERLK